MLVVGAGGFAKELIEVFKEADNLDELVFLDTVSSSVPSFFYGYKILRTLEQAKDYFDTHGNQFCLGLGNPKLRKNICEELEGIGGSLSSAISPSAKIAHFDVNIDSGCTILTQAIIANGCKIGKGCLIYHNAQITHDCTIGDYAELSPGATILGTAVLGNYVQIGANATVLPNVKVGDHAIVGAGAVVTKDVQRGQTVIGIPAK
ncbi:MAG: acetyltransferase [Crocinitomicaceae bacterium]|nr:acetyltransferase [Crocinitomicaceae bacterium]